MYGGFSFVSIEAFDKAIHPPFSGVAAGSQRGAQLTLLCQRPVDTSMFFSLFLSTGPRCSSELVTLFRVTLHCELNLNPLMWAAESSNLNPHPKAAEDSGWLKLS